MKIRKLQSSGFTLVELILYIVLLSIFISGAISFSWDVVYGREKSYQKQVVEQNARIVINKIAHEINQAISWQNLSSNQLVLINQAGTTTIELVSGKAQLSRNSDPPLSLSSNQVEITALEFENLGSSNNNAKNIRIMVSLKQSQGSSASYSASTTVLSANEFKGQFNQSRKLLPDTSGVNTVDPYTTIEGITLENSSNEAITIERMAVSWTNTDQDESLTAIQINGGVIEWSGSQTSSEDLFLLSNSYILLGSSGVLPINYLLFDKSMVGAEVKVTFALTDGSTVVSRFNLTTGEVTPTPTIFITPTPSPTPSVFSCSGYCADLPSYSTGACLKNAQECVKQGTVYESGGDQYCTGGPAVDTCCCN